MSSSSKTKLITPLPNTPLYNDPSLEPPKPLDFARILAPLKPLKDQEFFLFSYYINETVTSVDDPYVVQFIIGGFSTKDDAIVRMKELASVTKMTNWGISRANHHFTFTLTPDKEIMNNLTINNGTCSYDKIQEQVYEKEILKYNNMIESENKRCQMDKKITDPDNYEYYRLFLNTYNSSLKDLEQEKQRLVDFENNLAWRKSEIDKCLAKHPEFEEIYNNE